MLKVGCTALVAVACCATVPAAHAEGDFFVAGQVGQARYDDSALTDDTATTSALSVGYRWQAGPITQVGIELGGGRVDEVGQDYAFAVYRIYNETGRIGFDARYRHVGANARVNLGRDSRWFVTGRAGYVRYTQDVDHEYTRRYVFINATPTFNDSYSEDGSGAYFGAGIGFDVTPKFNVNLMLNGYAFGELDEDGELDDEATASTATLGLELRF